MPDNESKDHPEQVVYWPEDGHNEFGEFKLGVPAQVNARVERRRTVTSDPSRNTIDHDMIMNVDQDMTEGGTIYLGDIGDLVVGNTVNTMKIVEFEKVPDLKGRKFDRHALLKRDRRKEITVSALQYNGALVFYNGQPLFYNTGQRRSDRPIIETDPVIPTPSPLADWATETVVSFTPGDISKSAWDTFRATLPVNGTTLRPQPATFNLSQGVSAAVGRPIVGDQFEVPGMTNAGWFSCTGYASPHNAHNMLFLSSPEGKLHPLHGGYAEHGRQYEIEMVVDLTDALVDYQAKRWMVIWQLHPGTFPGTWTGNKNPPMAITLINGSWRAEHKWEVGNAGVAYTDTRTSSPIAVTTGPHTIKVQWNQDSTGAESFYKAWIDDVVLYESSEPNAINYSGITGALASTISIGNYQSSGDPVYPSLNLGSFTLLRGT